MQANDNTFQINKNSLTGSSQDHLRDWSADAVDIGYSLNSSIPRTVFLVHSAVLTPLNELRQLAAGQGFDLRICSSFRNYDRQLKIWNDKFKGLRPVYNDKGEAIDLTQLSAWQQIQAVMRWSALPGASRHHWGTDFDIYDAAAIDNNYQIQLTPQEVESEGVFAPFHDWLDTVIQHKTDFYRPYAKDTGGIAPERWHISYRPVATHFAASLTENVIAERLLNTELLLKDTVLQHLHEIYLRYISISE